MVYYCKMPRKKLLKTALPRLCFIDREIGAGNYPNAPALAKKYETSLSSINRDIAYMRDMLGAPIAYDFYKKGFYYTEKTFRLSVTFASADDLLALGMAKNLMELYENTPIHDAALNLLENISAPLQDENGAEWFKDRIVIPKSASAPVDLGIWNSIVSGLRENLVITFQYSGSSENKKSETRSVHPYQLLFDSRAWYLFAYDEDRKNMRMFALPRITNVSVTKKTFNIPKNFDYRSLEGASYFAIYAGAKTYHFVIQISGDTRWIKERLWAEDQKIKEIRLPEPVIETIAGEASVPKETDGIELSFTSNQLEKVLEWVLSQSPRAKPLAPKALVDRWKDAVQKAAWLSV